MSKAFDALREKLNDPIFIEEMMNHFKEEDAKKNINVGRMKKFFSDEESFSNLIIKIIQKHDDRWTDLCYKNGCEPYPWNILYAICNIVEDEGTEVGPVDGLTENFPSSLFEYRGWIFAWTHGQGTVLSIYNKGKELIYRS
jgi:hypothetical protein